MTSPDRRFIAVLILATAFLAVSGCGLYSTQSGSVDDRIRKVHIPYLENRTSEPTIGIDLTEDIIAALQEDNTLKVVNEEDASADITGTVMLYKLKEAFSSVQGSNIQVDEYQLQIMVELTYRVRDGGEEIFSKKRVRGTGNFQLDGANGTSESTARSEAAAEIVRDVLAAIVEDW